MASDKFNFNKPRFLMCEGDDDKGFLETLIQKRSLPEFQICRADECNTAGADGKGVGGKSGFKPSLAGFSSIISGFSELTGILIVGDNDTKDSFKEICDALTANGHTAPVAPDKTGTIHTKPVAVLMIPRHDKFGDLELLCLPAIHEKWPKAPGCVEPFLKCTGADKWGKQSSLNKARARAATLGFNEQEPFKGIGHLLRGNTLSAHNTCFDEIAEFLKNFDKMCGINP